MKFSVDPWDPSYGIANEAEALEPTSADVNADIELATDEWRPLDPAAGAQAESVLFIDGVRRVEARVWLDDGAGGVHAGICASYAAGAARCSSAARIGPVIVDRGLFTSFGQAESVTTRSGAFPARLAAGEGTEALSLALQERMGQAEVTAAEAACAEAPADLVVIDGPLRGRQHLSHAVGYVKTHHVAYLPAELHALVGGLAPGQRSPLFVLGTSWSRLAWYLRLPGTTEIPWSGVVRCECSPDLQLPAAKELADRITSTLPRFASEPHKEPRAPQNLYPIAGLERELRRRMGDPQVLYRALRRSAHTSVSA
ncbi:MAG TPA: DNA double-strand break repair nuclease NurA [Acidimicrobiales bacterium]|nr:DNA double-strand break repair nuclease NurA [Acidimicrobiales bacterium]